MFKAIAVLVITLLISFAIFWLVTNDRPQVAGIKSPPNTTNTLPQNYENGTWLWQSPKSLNYFEIRRLLKFCEEQNIDTIYLSIDDYMDISEISEPEKKRRETRDFENKLKFFLKRAKSKNIKVHALAGNTMWANSSHSYIPNYLLDYVLNFNKDSKNAKFSGIQFDIESYNQPDFKSSQVTQLTDYLNLVQQLTTKVNNEANFEFGMSVPFWFNDEFENNPIFTWNGQENVVGKHLLSILNQTPNSYIAIMAYRNTTAGENGSIALANRIISYSSHNTPNVSMIVGIETSQVENEPNISFFGGSKQAVIEAALEITSAFSTIPSFKGVAIHHLSSFKALVDF